MEANDKAKVEGEIVTKFRRGLIEQEVLQGKSRKITFDEVKKRLKKKFYLGKDISETTLYNDREYFQRNQKPIGIRKKAFVFDEEGLTTVARRGVISARAKELIGALASNIIVSPLPKEKDGEDKAKVPKVYFQCVNSQQFSPRLESKILSYWNKPHRLAILDAGTTTAAIARHLKPLKSPDPRRHLAQLRILTNGLNILEELKDSPHGVILLGGSLRRDTGAVAGLLAERCLEAWGLDNADIAIIGTTNLNNRFEFCCDSEEEAAVKSRLLLAARIRCVAADASKLMGISGSVWAFAPLSDAVVDIVITDKDITEIQKDNKLEAARCKFIEGAKGNGVFIAVASAPEVTKED